MSVQSTVEKALEKGQGIRRLAPTRVPRVMLEHFGPGNPDLGT